MDKRKCVGGGGGGEDWGQGRAGQRERESK